MKEIPILFSTPMVQAELDGRKTMTRRLKGLELINENPNDWQFEWAEPLRNLWTFTQKSSLNEQSLRDKTFKQFQTKCPYGRPGDLLWVRETFFGGYLLDDNDSIPDDAPLHYWYFADTRDARPGDMSDNKCAFLFGNNKKDWPRWKPSIHMPKEAARVWLRVTDIRVERLQDITPWDVLAEGFGEKFKSGATSMTSASIDHSTWSQRQVKLFSDLWIKINGPESWNTNPWVWVVSFKVLSTTGKPSLLTEKVNNE